ncbi:hypothetical protein [Nocardia sp. NPDC056000]|uniref:hypothetical protein n=1 Tax=Nocardia sp. NPDC056000 TaxID=3345674 RepID=UPI0035DCA6A6
MGGSGAITAKMVQAADSIADALVYKVAPRISKTHHDFPHEIRNSVGRVLREDHLPANKLDRFVRGPAPKRFERQSGQVEAGAGSGVRSHPLRGLWLERKVPADSIDPFTSIMDLPHRDAAAVAHSMGKRIEGVDYVDTRRQAEAWLRSHAVQKGSPTADSPLYFKLVSDDGTFPPPEGSVVIRIPADSIPVEHLTFTVEDSFFHYQLVAGIRAGNTPPGLVPHIIHGVDADTAMDFAGVHRDYLDAVHAGRYIEAQLWSRDDPILAQARMRFQEGIPADRTIVVHPAP